MGHHLQQKTAYLFDFDGTLYPSSAGIEAQIKSRFLACAMSRLGLSASETKKLLQKYREQYRSSVLGLQEHHGIDPTAFYEDLYSGLDISNMAEKPGLRSAITSLSKTAPLYLLSNSNQSFVIRGLERLKLRDYFSGIFTVEDNNFIRKPNPEVYHATLDRLRLDAGQVLMFDDIPSSLKTAKAHGFGTVLVGNGLDNDGYVDLHTGERFSEKPDWCDYADHDIARFIRERLLRNK